MSYTWDQEDCPQPQCDGELQQQDDHNVMCLSCGEVWSHWTFDDYHALADENGSVRVTKPLTATEVKTE